MEERPYNTPNWVTRWTDVHIITSWAALTAVEKGEGERVSSLPNLDEFAVSRLR